MQAEMQTIGMIFATQLVPKLSRHEALQLLFTLKEVSNKDQMVTTLNECMANKDLVDDDALATSVVKAMAALCGTIMEEQREVIAKLNEKIRELEIRNRPDPSPVQETKVWTSNNTGPIHPLLGRSALEMPK